MAEGAAKILVIDDDPGVLGTVESFLKEEGFEVITASSGPEGLEQLEQTTPDLLILDVKMPGMSGIAFLNEISPEPGSPKIPTLVFTAYAHMTSVFEDSGVEGIVLKPCSADQLLGEVNRVLAERGVGDAAAKLGENLVVVVSDNSETSKALEEEFAAMGMDCEVVADPSDAIAVVVMRQPRLAVIKAVLPELNGYTLGPMLREIPKTAATAIVMYDDDGYAEAECRRMATDQRGSFRYVPDDFTPGIVAAVKNLLS